MIENNTQDSIESPSVESSAAADAHATKPPLGIMPEYFWLEEVEAKQPKQHSIPMSGLVQARICALTQAINDYAHFKQGRRQLALMEIWTEELRRRINDLRVYGYA